MLTRAWRRARERGVARFPGSHRPPPAMGTAVPEAASRRAEGGSAHGSLLVPLSSLRRQRTGGTASSELLRRRTGEASWK